MIITTDKQVQSTHYFKSQYVPYFLGVVLLIGCVLGGIFYFASLMPASSDGLIVCDAENVIGKKFVTNGHKFGGGITQSSERARSGKYACLVNQDNMYGMSYKLKNPTPGDSYKLSVWRYRVAGSFGYLAVKAKDTKDFYKQEELAVKTRADGWDLVELYFNVPINQYLEVLDIYVYTNKNGTVFFDDLRIENITHKQQDTIPASFTPVHARLMIKPAAYKKLKDKRDEAKNIRLLITGEDDWVKGEMLDGEERTPVKLRLKGDWLDHLQGDKWSYRVKVKDPHAWNRMITFSLQTPKARGFLNQWVFFKMLEQEGLLAPRHDFMTLSVNDQPLGTYAYEEHFDKQLPEYGKRREGPIVKFSEDGFWLYKKRQFDRFDDVINDLVAEKNAYNMGQTQAFKAAKTQQSPNLAAQFEIAQSLMQDYKYGVKPASEIFDLDQLAKFFALTDITRSYHGLRWHNQRFYYNPVTTRLEPIGFDSHGIAKLPNDAPYLGFDAFYNKGYNRMDIFYQLFDDPDFTDKYIFYVEKFSKRAYVEAFLLKIEQGLTERENFLKKEFEEVAFDKTALVQKARLIQAKLRPLNELSLEARIQQKTEDSLFLKIANHHYLPLKVVGFGKRKTTMLDSLKQPLNIIPNPKNSVPTYTDLMSPPTANYVFYQLAGITDSTYYSPISTWKVPESGSPINDLFEKTPLATNEVYSVANKVIFFKKGTHQIEQNILIPEGYKVNFEAGCALNFIKKAKFISRSPVFMYGTEDEPIKIYSADKTANGFTVLQAGERSELHHVVFENLNTLNYKGWQLTGAVTFYESDVLIDRCGFLKNHCEDGLNIIRSDFEMTDCLVSDTPFDGFDCDFCTGKVKKSTFYKTGNDGMDFSGSVISVIGCTLKESGDKGISVGEEATVRVWDTTIDGCTICAASKDLSTLYLWSVSLNNCTQGVAAYQKKPEFGGAKIIIDKYETNNVKHLYQIELGSTLRLQGKLIKGE